MYHFYKKIIQLFKNENISILDICSNLYGENAQIIINGTIEFCPDVKNEDHNRMFYLFLRRMKEIIIKKKLCNRKYVTQDVEVQRVGNNKFMLVLKHRNAIIHPDILLSAFNHTIYFDSPTYPYKLR